ncbi:response regulator transcription factor [Erythrobacter alti]|uniref:response regulator transcription factor n=1 Tax=Erythrobacter alti TaxID=1896145 RepID=UPI0030F4B1B1
MISVLIADDHAFIRAGVEAVLRGSRYFIVATASNGAEALVAIEEHDPTLVILDLRMPNMDGLATLQELRNRGDQRPVILLTADLNDQIFLALIKAGANGVMLKDGAEERLITCLDAVHDGQHWIEPELVGRAMSLTADGLPAGPLSTLAPREQEVARLVGEGMRNSEIAEALGISEGTVKVHLHSIYHKLDIRSRTGLAIIVNSANS